MRARPDLDRLAHDLLVPRFLQALRRTHAEVEADQDDDEDRGPRAGGRASSPPSQVRRWSHSQHPEHGARQLPAETMLDSATLKERRSTSSSTGSRS